VLGKVNLRRTMDKIIKITNLKKYYGDIKAVDDISFEVERGDIFAFLGVNGAGKSTTINILSTLLKKDSGKVIIDDVDIDTNNFLIKEKIGIVFQNTVLDEKLTVVDNLKTRASYYGIRGDKWTKRLAELTEYLDLKELLNRPFGKLSGGQKRRVDIARGLINNPKIMFFDEPTTGLDPSTRVNIWKVIFRIQKENNMTVFLTTHYMEEAENVNDVVIIDRGKIIAHDTPENLKNLYSGNYVKLYGCPNVEIEKKLKELNLEFRKEIDVYIIRVESSKASLEFLETHKNLYKDFEVVKGNMDDVFLNATGKKLED